MPITTTLAGPEGRGVVVEHRDEVVAWPVDLPFDAFEVTAEQKALARELSLADLMEDLEQAARDDVEGWDPAMVWDREPEPADDLLIGLSGPAQAMDLVLLASIAPAELETNKARVAYLQCLDRVSALTASLRAEVLVEMAGPVATGDHLLETSLEHEVAVARRTSRYGSGRAIENARALARTFPRFAEALRAGEISEAHVSMLVDKTRAVTDDEVLAAVEKRVLGKAQRLPVGRFGKAVAAAVVSLDPDSVGRHRRARSQRGVYSRQLDDGLGFLGVVDEWGVISAIQATVDADAAVLRQQRGGARAAATPSDPADVMPTTHDQADQDEQDEDARVGACRVDALAARVLGRVATDGTVTWDPRESVVVNLDLVMDLDTLRGEVDRMALLEGQPVPAEIAREHARAVRTWRRVITDPVDGHLLDYGTRQYLPDRLRRYVLARDGGCIAPDCSTTSPRRLQMDHVVAFPHGPSSARNCDTKCITTHQLKTAGYADVGDAAADGSRTWITGWGQTVHIPPRPFLHDPRDDDGHPPDRPSAPTATRAGPPASSDSDTPPF